MSGIVAMAPKEKPPKVRTRAARLISPTQVRQLLLDTAAKTRTHRFTRVSQETLDLLEAGIRSHCVRIVQMAPSKGKTL